MTVFIFAFSPGHYTPTYIVNHDKMTHALVFLLLSFLLNISFKTLQIRHVAIIMFFVGLLIETIQFLFTYRGFSFEDIAYDIIGIIMYIVIKINEIYFRAKSYKLYTAKKGKNEQKT